MEKEFRILIFENVAEDAEWVERQLERGEIPFKAERVRTREDFLEQLKRLPPDLILADDGFPPFDGMAALELAKEWTPTVPLILLTDGVNEEAAFEYIRRGAANYVIKTHRVGLCPAVKGVLELKRMGEEKAQAEAALLASAREWRAAFDAVSDAIILMDSERRILRCNEAAGRLLGKPSREIIGLSCCQLLHGPTAPLAGCPTLRMKETCRRETLDFPLADRWLNIVSDPLTDESGRVIGAVHIFYDITESKKMEQEKIALEHQLRQSQKMEAIGRLAGGIAHDFNNLLTIIKGYSQLCLLGLKEGDSNRENAEEIQRATERAADLIRQLLAFSRSQVIETKVLDLNPIIQNLEKMLRRILGEDIELVIRLAPDLERVRMDPGQIVQVVMNLVVNAREAIPSVGKLTIETVNVDLNEDYIHAHLGVAPGRYLRLSVSDNGIGMSAEVKDRIFDPFFTTKEKGTGLGLSTVYGIVKQSGGAIWVHSEPGVGTIFKIYLPAVEEPLEEVEEREVSRALPRGRETVLVVEDYEEVRKLAARILSKQGYRVLESSSGNAALQLCEEHKEPIHLIVTDMVMPGMSGPELAGQLRVLHPELKVLYMSGYTDGRGSVYGLTNERATFIRKPFTVDGLSIKVRDALKEPIDRSEVLQEFDIQLHL